MIKIVLSCEHGGNQVPEVWKSQFQGNETVLNSHRGFDPGTSDLFDFLIPLADFGIKNEISRLLIEFNRSKHHPHLFSEWSQSLSSLEKERLISHYYNPYREKLIAAIASLLTHHEDTVIHLSLHSFTPELNGQPRNNDFGLLYDPKRKEEKEFAKQFKESILKFDTSFTVRYNYPYLGTADGLTTSLRRIFLRKYVGIELEINQKWVKNNAFHKDIKSLIYGAIAQIDRQRFR